MSKDDITGTLNHLIETCKDGEYGFRSCSELVKSSDLRNLLRQRADGCAEAARELQAQVELLGAKPDTHGSAAAAMHRGWVSLRGKLAGLSDAAILEECELGADKAFDRYREVVKQDLPAALKAIIERQFDGARQDRDLFRTLRERFKATA